MQLDYEVPKRVLATPVAPPETFWERFEFAFDHNAQRVFTDRFHSFNTMRWYLELADHSADELRDRTTREARGAFSRSVVTGVREAAIDLPFMVWLEGRQDFLSDLLLHSLDTVEEEAVAPLDPAYRLLERSWWQRLSNSRDFYYGLRPFQTSPYAFIGMGIRNGDTVLVLAHLRYHYSHYADHEFEFALSLPLAHGVSIDAGTAYRFGQHQEAQVVVLKLFKQFAGGGIMHVGMELQQHPTFVVGMSLPL